MNLYVDAVGSSKYPRLAIRCQNGLYWTGKDWSTYSENALTYSNSVIINQDLAKLQAEMGACVEFVAPIFVKVKTDQKIDIEELKNFLTKASEFLLDYYVERPKSLEDAIVSSCIHWDQLEELKKNSSS